MRLGIAFATVLLLGSVAEQHLLGAVVYDSLSSSPLFGGRDFTGKPELGQAISLDGIARSVTQIDIDLSGNESNEFRVRFYRLDGFQGSPGSLIWESPVQLFEFIPPHYNRRIIEVPVPNVVVPTSFAWIVAVNVTNGAYGMRYRSQTSIGVTHDYWYTTEPQSTELPWIHRTGTFGARITAVPEPSSLAIVLIAAMTLGYLRLLRQAY